MWQGVTGRVESIGNAFSHPGETLGNMVTPGAMATRAADALTMGMYSSVNNVVNAVETVATDIQSGNGSASGQLVGSAAVDVAATAVAAGAVKAVGAIADAAKGATAAGEGAATAAEGGTQTVYRAFGGDARAQGSSWTTTNPASVKNFRDVAGLPSGGASGVTNTADFMVKGTVNTSNIIESRPALKLDGNKGGLRELIIDPKNVNITDFKVLKP